MGNRKRDLRLPRLDENALGKPRRLVTIGGRHPEFKGMRTLRMDGWEKAMMGATTLEEVLRVTQSDV